MINPNRALCAGSPDPDMWFPEGEGLGQRVGSYGRPTIESQRKMIETALIAMDICRKCPVRADCLIEGMKEDNIEHGIWGGIMAGDRILLANSRRSGEVRAKALALAERIRLWKDIG